MAKAIIKGVIGALGNLNRKTDLPKEAIPLLKGRTDEEVANYLRIAPLNNFLIGMNRKLSGPQSGENWFPGANIRLGSTMSELDEGKLFIPRSDNYEAQVRDIPIESLQGMTAVPLVGDRTATGTLKRILGQDLANPVDLQGGKNYMRGAEEGAWASELGALSKLADRLPEIENPVGIYTPMAGTGSDFAHMTTDVLHQIWSPSQMTGEGIDTVNKVIRGTKVKNPKTKEITYPFANAPSIDDPKFMQLIEANSPLRKTYVQALDKAALRKQGAPDMGAIRHAITDPDLMNISPPSKDNLYEQMMGYGVTDLSPTGAMRPSTHKTYNTDLLSGEKGYMGKLPLTPRSVLMRDWTRMRRSLEPNQYGDPRSIFTGPVKLPQIIDQEIIDATEGYQALVRQLQE